MACRYSVTWVLIGLMTTCPSGRGLAAEDAETGRLKAAAAAFWHAQESEDWSKLYQILSPKDLSGIPEKQFVDAKARREKLRYSAVQVTGAEIDGDFGWTEVDYSYRPKGFEGIPPVPVHQWDAWRKEAGTWRPLPPERRSEAPAFPPSLRARDEEAALMRRMDEFWAARETGNWSALYRMLAPAFRTRESEAEFLSKRAMYLYLSHRLAWIEVPRGSAEGRGKIDYAYKLNDPSLSKMPGQRNSSIEDWVKVDGEWYRQAQAKPREQAGEPSERSVTDREREKNRQGGQGA
jgi:hypothetical protein